MRAKGWNTGFHVKPKRKQKNPEGAFQAALVRELRRMLTPATFMTHFPAGGGGPIRGALLKLRGLVPGVPDLLFIHEGRAFWMELKSKAGRNRLEPSQIACHLSLRLSGCHVEVVRNLDDALECLRLWDIPLRLSQDSLPAMQSRPSEPSPKRASA